MKFLLSVQWAEKRVVAFLFWRSIGFSYINSLCYSSTMRIYFASGRYPTLYNNNNNHFFFGRKWTVSSFFFYREIGHTKKRVETHNVFSSHLSGPCVCVIFRLLLYCVLLLFDCFSLWRLCLSVGGKLTRWGELQLTSTSQPKINF